MWCILPDQREYYTKQFLRLQPAIDGVVKGNNRIINNPVRFCQQLWEITLYAVNDLPYRKGRADSDW